MLNMAISWVVFTFSDLFIRVLGNGGTRALAKVADMFLAAIAVMMIRLGVLEFILRLGVKK